MAYKEAAIRWCKIISYNPDGTISLPCGKRNLAERSRQEGAGQGSHSPLLTLQSPSKAPPNLQHRKYEGGETCPSK